MEIAHSNPSLSEGLLIYYSGKFYLWTIYIVFNKAILKYDIILKNILEFSIYYSKEYFQAL